MATYYVATTGNDANPGTSSLPFRTIQKGANVANAGDVVIVRDGIYTTASGVLINLTRSGTVGAYITFKAENKWQAKLNGQNNATGYCFNFSNSVSYIKIQDFEIYGFNNQCVDANNYFNGTSALNNYVEVSGNKMHDIHRVGDEIDYGKGGIYSSQGNHHWSILRNIMYNIGRTSYSQRMVKDHGVYLGTHGDSITDAGHNNIIAYNIFYNISGNAINIGGYDEIITNNVMAWQFPGTMGTNASIATEDGISGSVLRLTVENNIIIPDASGPYAIECWSTASNIANFTVRNNMVYGGSMWWSDSSYTAAAMKGNNYGQSDCEHAQVNPLFVSSNHTTPDFHLQAGSPAINNGIYTSYGPDFDGVVIGNPSEMGAYEYLSTTTTTTSTLAPTTTTTSTTGVPTTTTTTTGTPTTTTTSTTATPTTTTTTTGIPTTTTTTTAGPTTTSTTTLLYRNAQMSVTLKRDNCPSGYTGSSVTYIVYVGKYTSTVSQADADAQAAADLNINKQLYANTYGTCTAITAYYNVRMSVKVTRNNCPAGYTGSTVTYTVVAGKYNSSISQADANYKAQVDLDVNKQVYANTHGTCKKNRR